MKKHQFSKIGLFVCVAALTISFQVHAAGLAEASGVLAEVAVISTQASAALAAAAITGDIEAIADAQKRADAVNAAMAEAQEAYAAMERAVAGGNVAASAEDLEVALQKAEAALNGPVPEATPESLREQWKKSQKNTGGGPGRSYDPPNIYDVPWQTQGLRNFYQGLFGSFWSASSHGDHDATPE